MCGGRTGIGTGFGGLRVPDRGHGQLAAGVERSVATFGREEGARVVPCLGAGVRAARLPPQLAGAVVRVQGLASCRLGNRAGVRHGGREPASARCRGCPSPICASGDRRSGQTPRPGRRRLPLARWLCLRLVRPGSASLVGRAPSAGCGLTAKSFRAGTEVLTARHRPRSCPCLLSGTRRPPSRVPMRVHPHTCPQVRSASHRQRADARLNAALRAGSGGRGERPKGMGRSGLARMHPAES
jgi:hypothetical protein